MKKFLPQVILFVLVSITGAYAQTSQLLIGENFTGYSNSNVNGQGGWTASGNANFVQVATSTPLSYPNYTSGTQYVNVVERADYSPGKHPDDPYKPFNGGNILVVTGNTTFYMSFLVRVPNNTGVQTTGTARPTLALRALNGSTMAHFYIGDANSGSSLKFGINKDGSAGGTYASGSYSFNTTYLIVIRYDVANGGFTSDYDDKMYMWVNPVLSSEPSTSSAQVAIDNFFDFNYDGGFTGVMQSLQLFQETNSATASFDAFKVSYARAFSTTTANASAAWNALSPIGIPLPVKFGDIKGYAKNAGIELAWNVYSEFNVARYEIERSSDGVSFSKAGSVTPKNADGELQYDWFDAVPLAGNNYYRIKNVDIDGKSAYSSVIKVSLGNLSASGFSVYPNPVTGNHISLQAVDLQRGNYKIEIFSTSGQQVYKKQFSHAGGTINQSLELPNALQSGIYNIQLTGSGFKGTKQFLVQ